MPVATTIRKEQTPMSDGATRAWMLLALLAGLALRLHDLDGDGLWLDELFSVRAATRESWAGLVDEVGRDVHPPLYFALLRLTLDAAGATGVAARGLSVVVGGLGIVAAGWLGTRLVDARAGVAAACLQAVAPFAVALDREARGNALLAALSTLGFALLVGRPGRAARVGWAVTLALAAWTHVFAFAFAAASVLWLLLTPADARGPLRGWLAAAAGAAVLVAPWLPTVVAQAQSYQAAPWYAPPAPDVLAWLLPTVAGGGGPAALLGLGVVLALALGGPRPALLLVAGLGGLLFVPFLVSQVVPVLRDRNVVALVPVLCVVAGAGYTRLPGPAGAGLVALSVLGLGAVSLGAEGHGEDWRGAAAVVRAEWQPGDRVEANHPNLWRFYLPEVDEHPKSAGRTFVLRAHEDLHGTGDPALGELVREWWFDGAHVSLRDPRARRVRIGEELGPPMWQDGVLRYYWNQSVRAAAPVPAGRCAVGLVGKGEVAGGEGPRFLVRLVGAEGPVATWTATLGAEEASWWSPEVDTPEAWVEVEFVNDGTAPGPDGTPVDRNAALSAVWARCG